MPLLATKFNDTYCWKEMNRERAWFPTDDIDLVLSIDGFVVVACGSAWFEALMVGKPGDGVGYIRMLFHGSGKDGAGTVMSPLHSPWQGREMWVFARHERLSPLETAFLKLKSVPLGFRFHGRHLLLLSCIWFLTSGKLLWLWPTCLLYWFVSKWAV